MLPNRMTMEAIRADLLARARRERQTQGDVESQPVNLSLGQSPEVAPDDHDAQPSRASGFLRSLWRDRLIRREPEPTDVESPKSPDFRQPNPPGRLIRPGFNEPAFTLPRPFQPRHDTMADSEPMVHLPMPAPVIVSRSRSEQTMPTAASETTGFHAPDPEEAELANLAEEGRRRDRRRRRKRRAGHTKKRRQPQRFLFCFPFPQSAQMRAHVLRAFISGIFLVCFLAVCKSSSCSWPQGANLW